MRIIPFGFKPPSSSKFRTKRLTGGKLSGMKFSKEEKKRGKERETFEDGLTRLNYYGKRKRTMRILFLKNSPRRSSDLLCYSQMNDNVPAF